MSLEICDAPRLASLSSAFLGECSTPPEYDQWFICVVIAAFRDNPYHPTMPGLEVLRRALAYYRKHPGDLPWSFAYLQKLIMDKAIA